MRLVFEVTPHAVFVNGRQVARSHLAGLVFTDSDKTLEVAVKEVFQVALKNRAFSKAPGRWDVRLGRRVDHWVRSRFGDSVAENLCERTARLLEEAAELAQACGLPENVGRSILDRVFANEPDDPDRELGGVLVTTIAYAEAAGVDLEELALRELERIERVPVQETLERHAAKREAGCVARHTPIRFTD